MVQIREAIISDSHQIRTLEHLVWEMEVTTKWDSGTYISEGIVFVAEDFGVLVGALVSIWGKNSSLYVVDLVVHPDYRRQGIAEVMYKRLMIVAKNKYLGLRTHVSPIYTASVALHKKLGFRVVRLEENAYGLQETERPHLLMEI